MQALMRLRPRLFGSISNSNHLCRISSYLYSSSSSSSSPRNPAPSPSSGSSNLFSAPWTSIQRRGIKVSGSDIRVGHMIRKKGHIYEVLKVNHTHEGRGKGRIEVELHDMGQGEKVTQQMRADANIERVYLQVAGICSQEIIGENCYFMWVLYAVMVNPDTLDQVKVSKDLFAGMKVIVDEKPLSASVPKHVTRTVKEEIAATPWNQKGVLDNGLTVEGQGIV